MDIQQLQLATMIAILRKQFNVLDVKRQIGEGLRTAREIGIDKAIAEEAGGQPIHEEAIVEINKTATDGAGNYVEICSWTVTAVKTGVLAKVEMASADYDNVQWRITIAGKKVLEDKELPSATTITLPDLVMRGGVVTKIEAKDTDSTAHNVWGDISGKEVV